MVTSDSRPGSEPSGPRVRLEVLKGPKEGLELTCSDKQTLIVGRGGDCHVRIEGDRKISRHHFLLEIDPPDVGVCDLGSRNGTWVNKKRLRGTDRAPEGNEAPAGGLTALYDGDEVRAGKTVLGVRIKGRQGPPTETLELDSGGEALAEIRPEITGYELGHAIGVGGFGAVYKARRTADGETVAVKIMLARGSASENGRKRFEREIRIQLSLMKGEAHAHVVRALDHGRIGNQFYFVMEFCDGGSVEDLLRSRGGALERTEAVRIILQALEGLAGAHSAGIVHRDIKPANILLCGEPGSWTAKISDLGLAKHFEMTGLSGLTLTGMSGGTPQYMPREQVLDFKRVTPAGDVWSMGATLYHMLSGRYPREHTTRNEILAAALRGTMIPILEHDPSTPPVLAEFLDRALQAEPARRFPDARAMRSALLRLVPELT